MIKTIAAVFDGKVFRPKIPPLLEPNTPVRLTVETVSSEAEQPVSFLQVARSLNLDGPPDWAANLETYLYGGAEQNAHDLEIINRCADYLNAEAADVLAYQILL